MTYCMFNSLYKYSCTNLRFCDSQLQGKSVKRRCQRIQSSSPLDPVLKNNITTSCQVILRTPGLVLPFEFLVYRKEYFSFIESQPHGLERVRLCHHRVRTANSGLRHSAMPNPGTVRIIAGITIALIALVIQIAASDGPRGPRTTPPFAQRRQRTANNVPPGRCAICWSDTLVQPSKLLCGHSFCRRLVISMYVFVATQLTSGHGIATTVVSPKHFGMI